jgi:NAD(P)-dependent dehydrogenase (short-subunit alcohol dehydrogenase family)
MKYLLITGATSGIGQEMAIKFSKSHNLVICARNEAKAIDLINKFDGSHDYRIWLQDLSLVDTIENSLINFLANEKITIDKFIHSAGTMRLLSIKSESILNMLTTYSVNVFSAALITKILVSKKHNNLALKSSVFISSNLSNRAAKGMSIYGSSKGGLDSLMRCLAIELAPKSRFNSVLSGAVKTDMTKDIFDNTELVDRMLALYPLGAGEPNDIYNVVNFLLSDESRWINGQQLIVDGGRSMNISA